MRVYIAVGSTAIECLIELIHRYQEEGLDENREDRFFGLDTNLGPLDRLMRSEREGNRVIAVQVKSEPANSNVRHLLPKIQSRWIRYRDASIPGDGVGGDRRLSFATLRWRNDISLNNVLSGLKIDDEIIIIGTAFGGTSTGLFWNVAQWVRTKMPSGPARDAERGRYYGFLILPGELGDVRAYPWPYNFCGFMQDMQSLDLLNRIQRQLQADVACLFPYLPCYGEATDAHLVPVYDPTRHGYSQHSFLPMDRLILVPTPAGEEGRHSHIPSIVAEQALLLGPLGGWYKMKISESTIDLWTHRQGRDYRLPDYAFGGFNMISARSARRKILQSVFANQFRSQLEQFVSPNFRAASGPFLETIRALLEKKISDDGNADLAIDNRRKDLINIFDRTQARNLTECTEQIDKLCRDLDSTLSVLPFRWPDLKSFIALVAVLWSEQLKSSDEAISMSDLLDAYKEAAKKIEKLADQKADVRNRLLSLPNQLKSVRQRRLKRLAVRLLAAERRVDEELTRDCRTAIIHYFEWFAKSCRAAATRKQILPEGSITQEAYQLASAIKKRLDSVVQEYADPEKPAENPACIYEDQSSAPDLTSLKVSRSRVTEAILKSVTLDDPSAQQMIVELANEMVENLSTQCRQMGAADPLRNITLDLSRGRPPKSFSDAFACRDGDKYHHHFIFSRGAVAPILWGQLASFNSSFYDSFRLFSSANPTPQQPIKLKSSGTLTCDEIPSMTTQGLWLGTLRTDLSIREAIDIIYRRQNKPINNWQNLAYRSVAEGGEPNCLLPLNEWVGLSLVFGIVGKKLCENPTVKQKGCTVSISGTNISWRINANEASAYLAGQEGLTSGTIKLQYLHINWISDVTNWLRSGFWKDIGQESLRDYLNFLDRDVLEQITLSIDEEKLCKPLVVASRKLEELIKVTLNDA